MGSQRRTPVFRPVFTVMLLWFAVLFVLFAFLFILPDMLAAVSDLPPGPEELSEEELALARETARQALSSVEVGLCFVLALGVTAFGAWRGVLPGLRK